ncbi:hypothetical protein J2X05_003339 [Cellvibrio fibrivorans]|jgi:hypothetical protein|uniref:Uncharacterized protein n=1 Tax=Cellvibrio fibrivorans TaxID=126350 RepID=A0ABU1V1H3_9GAMM|nr:hypothetical protein [Cellvibrio fibrivorans]
MNRSMLAAACGNQSSQPLGDGLGSRPRVIGILAGWEPQLYV